MQKTVNFFHNNFIVNIFIGIGRKLKTFNNKKIYIMKTLMLCLCGKRNKNVLSYSNKLCWLFSGEN